MDTGRVEMVTSERTFSVHMEEFQGVAFRFPGTRQIIVELDEQAEKIIVWSQKEVVLVQDTRQSDGLREISIGLASRKKEAL